MEKSIRLQHVFWSFLLSCALSFFIWRAWNPKSLLFFVVALMLAEAFIKIRWRMYMVCCNCGFDPVIYVRNSDKALSLVQDFLDKNAGQFAKNFCYEVNTEKAMGLPNFHLAEAQMS